MNNLNILEWLGRHIVAILFLMGLLLINMAVYLIFGVEVGLIASGLTLILIALIINAERNSLRR